MDNNKKLSLGNMKNMSIDEIVNLYRSGYKIENLQTCEDLGCVSTDTYNQLVVKYNELAQIQRESIILVPGVALAAIIGFFLIGRWTVREEEREKIKSEK